MRFVFLSALLAAASAHAGPLACRAPVEGNAGEALFTKTPVEIADRCAAQLAGNLATAAGAVQCLLLVHDVDGVVPTLTDDAKKALEKLVRDAPSGGILVDPPLVQQSWELLALADPAAARGLAHQLTAYGNDELLKARGAQGLALTGTDDDLRAMSLGVVSKDRAVKIASVAALARRASPVTNPLLLPLLGDRDKTLAYAAQQGFAQSPEADERLLRDVLADTLPERVNAFVEALLDRAEPRSGRRAIRSDELARMLWKDSDETCLVFDDAHPNHLRLALRVAGPELRARALDVAWNCPSTSRTLGLGVAEWAGFAADPNDRATYAKAAQHAIRAASEGAFTAVERDAIDALVDNRPLTIVKALRTPGETARTIETVRWGGQGAAARQLRAFGLEAFTNQVPGCEDPSMLINLYAAMRAAERRDPQPETKPSKAKPAKKR